ncbi:hemagglutinin repeat-containing protein [Halomonas cupida]|uniref:two-partner secretion domain-containing protein n=1 Tax=Halomonas cupida TaxID=44933 RepID=UPI0039B38DB0
MHMRRSLTRGIAIILANAMFWQPVVVLASGAAVNGISVAPGSGNTRLDQAGNGVPVINIDTPNANGLSHNVFRDYNVDQRGVILNNATREIKEQPTQLGGLILGNSNLSDGAARTILNEVNGGSPSRLEGYTEVAGQSANVVVANPHGITCDGCGFINTPEATLSTGRPVIEQGNLERFAVDQGKVAIEGLGLNARTVDRFDIITRAAEINADIHADQLNIVAGANNVDADSLATTPRNGSGTKPTVAIDSSALGGMYANRIRLVGTENGVGVHLAGDMAAHGGDLTIDANGQLRLRGDASSTGAVRLAADSADLSGNLHGRRAVTVDTSRDLNIRDGQLTSASDIALSAGQTLRNEGQVVAGVENDERRAGGDITLNATKVTNVGDMDATRRLEVAASTATNQGGWLASEIDVQVDRQLTNQGSISGREVTIATPTLTNQTPTGQQEAATIAATESLTLDTDRLTNSGTLQYARGQDIRFDGEHFDNRGGTLQLNQGKITGHLASLTNTDGTLTADRLDVDVSGNLSNQRGLISAEVGNLQFDVAGTLNNANAVMQSRKGRFVLDAAVVNNTNGKLVAERGLALTSERGFGNRGGGLQSYSGNLTLDVGSLDNRKGLILAEQALDITSDAALVNRAGTLLASTGTLSARAASVDNSEGGVLVGDLDVNLIVSGALDNHDGGEGGIQSRSGNVSLDVGRIDNTDGLVQAAKSLAISSDAALINSGGTLSATGGSLTGSADTLDNRSDGVIAAEQQVRLIADGAVNNSGGGIQSRSGNVVLDVGSLNNRNGKALAERNLTLSSDAALNNAGGTLSATRGALTATAGSITNTDGGAVVAEQQLNLTSQGQLNNAGGGIQSRSGSVALNVGSLNNRNGKALAERNLTLTSDAALNNAGGTLSATRGALTATAGSITNTDDGAVVAEQQLSLTSRGQLNNAGGGIQSRSGNVVLDVGSLDNRNGKALAERNLAITSGAALNNAGGTLSASRGTLTATAGSITNTDDGAVAAEQQLSLTSGGQLNNAGGGIQSRSGNVVLDVGSLDNRNGKALAERNLTITSDAALNNAGGTLSATRGALTATAGSITNTDGGAVVAEQQLSLTSRGQLNNAGGGIQSRSGNLILAVADDAALINTAGTLLASQGSLTATAGRLDNSGDGALVSRGDLELTTQNALDNRQGGIQSTHGSVDLNVGSLANDSGKVLADQSLTVTSAGEVSNTDGALQSRQDSLTLTADGLRNERGILLADQSLDITDRGETDNTDGNIQATEGSLTLTTDQLTNTGGVLLADQSLAVTSRGSVSNDRGIFQATQGSLTLDAASLDNTQGTLVAGKALDVATDTDLTNTGGMVEAQGGDLTLSAARLVNQGGNLVSEQSIDVTASRDVDNRSGVMHARGGDLALRAGSLDNRAGTLGAEKTVELTLIAHPDHQLDGALDNGSLEGQSDGQGDGDGLEGLISADHIDLKAEALANDGGRVVARLVDLALGKLSNVDGLISADERMSLDVAGLLDNTEGRLQVVDGDLSITQAERIDNTRGVMVGTRLRINADGAEDAVGTITNQNGQLVGDSLVVNAARLENTGNGLVSAENGNLTLTLDESLVNRGDLQATGDITLSADVIDNRQGGMLGRSFQLTATQLLNQRGALLGEAGGGRITLNADDGSGLASTLNNRQGVIDVLNGALSINAAPASVNNQSGSITADRLTITADRLDNRLAEGSTVKGQLVSVAEGAGDDLVLDITNILDNRGGVIAARNGEDDGGDLKATFSTLNNEGGILQADALRLTGTTLNNSQGGNIASLDGDATLVLTQTLDNQQGRIIANGQLDIDPPLIDNRGGELAGKTVNLVAGHLDNRKGVVESQGHLDIEADTLTNDDGDLASLGGTDSTITVANTLSNRAGRIALGSTDATLEAERIDNRGVDGESGEITHAGTGLLTFLTDYLDNQGGVIQGEGSATSELKDWDNLGQWGFNGHLTLDLDKALVVNEGDNLSTPGSLSLLLPSLTNAGEIRSNDGLVIKASGGSDNNIINSGVISTLGDLDITAHHLTQQDGRLASGGDATYTLSGNLDNLGVLTSVGDLSIEAANVINRGTLGSQKNLEITSDGCLQNGREDCDPSDSEADTEHYDSALMFAGGDMTLYATDLMNSYSDIYSKGDLLFALNEDRDFADSFQNRSGTVEAEGDIRIHASEVVNTRDEFETETQLVDRTASGIAYGYGRYQGNKDGGRDGDKLVRWYKDGEGTIGHDVYLSEDYETLITVNSPQATLIAGGDLNIDAEEVENFNSVMAANGNLEITADVFRNVGDGEYSTHVNETWDNSYTDTFWEHKRICTFRSTGSGGTCYDPENSAIDFSAWNAVDGVDSEGNKLPVPFTSGSPTSRSEVHTPTDGGNWAVVSAGKTVTINAVRDIQNGEIREDQLSQLTGDLGDTATGGPVGDISVTLNRRTNGADAAETADRMERQRRPSASASISEALVEVASTAAQTSDAASGANGDVGASGVDASGNDAVDGNASGVDASDTIADVSAVEASTRRVPPVADDVPFARVSATESESFLLPKGDYGLFVQSTSPQSRYLIETNPEFTELDQWRGSDYLLGKLGYTDDSAYRLLGDGRYETRLIRDEVLANTGQRFLDTSLEDDYAQYRYLMDNAIAAEEALDLRVGVGLTAEQMAALTHDIVWLEEQEIDGQKVLAPVLYLAQLDERSIRGGAVIQGRDIELIAGGDLVNVGTIRARDSLTAESGGSILQGGLVEAGGKVDLTARNDIRNALSGEIRGDDVRLVATEGDIINDRLAVVGGSERSYQTYIEEGGLIEARHDLEMRAGRDIVNRSEIISGDDALLDAGRDIRIEGVEDVRGSISSRSSGRTTTIGDVEQIGASLTVGDDLALDAGQDVNVTASDVQAGGRLAVVAGRDIDLASAANESHWEYDGRYVDASQHAIEQVGATLSGGEDVALAAGQDVRVVASRIEAGEDLAIDAGNDIRLSSAANRESSEFDARRLEVEEREVRQQGTEVVAGGNMAVKAGNDLTVAASTIEAEDEAYLYARNQVALTTAYNEDYYRREKESSGAFFKETSRTDMVHDQTAVGSDITTGGDLSIVSGGHQGYVGAQLDAGEDLKLTSGGQIVFANASDFHTESHEKSSSNALWQSAKGEGETVETLRQSQLTARGEMLINAAQGVNIQIEEINEQTVSQTIDAMVEADPTLAWLKDMEARGDIDWEEVKAIHDSWDYSHSGVSPVVMVVVAIVAAAFGQYYVTEAALAAGAGTTTAAAAGAAAGAVAAASAVATVNDPTNPFAGIKASFDEDTIKSAFTAAITAGIAQGLFPDTFDIDTLSLTNPDQIGQFATQQVTLATLNAGVDTAINGGSFEDNLQTKLEGALLNIASGKAFDLIGDLGYDAGSLENVVLHALTGGAIAELSGGDFKTGAIAAGAGEALVVKLDALVKENPTLLVAAVEATGATAAAIANGDPEDGAYIAGQGARYNYLPHKGQVAWLEEEAGGDPEKLSRLYAAACLSTRCSAQFPEDSEQYAYFRQLEEQAAGEDYAAERAVIEQSGEFEYDWLNTYSDADIKLTTSYPRLFGGIQGVFGLTEGAAGAAARNPFLLGKGADDAAAGFNTAIFGEPTQRFGSQGLSIVTGLPPEYADVMYDLAGGVAGASSANRAVSAGSVVEVPSGAVRAPNAGFDDLISSGTRRSADDVNATFPDGYSPPYTPGTQVTEFVSDGNQTFVRVVSGDSPGGQWIMKASDIEGLSPQQIADKFALPEVPSGITSVTPPAGTRIRTGEVNPNFGGAGGGTQFQLLDRVNDGWADVTPLQ